MAGCAGAVWAVVAGVRVVRVLAGGRGVGAGRGHAAHRGRRGRETVLAGVGGLDHLTGPCPRGRCPEGQRRSGCRRTRSPRAGPFPGRVGHQDPRRRRSAPGNALLHPDSGSGRRQPRDDHRPGGHRRRPPRRRAAPPTPRAGPGRQGLLLAGQPCLPVPTRHQDHHPRPGRPSRPPRPTRTPRRPTPAFDPVTYRDRHAVECAFSELKHHRCFATRYDKLAVRFAATVHVASINHWLKRLS